MIDRIGFNIVTDQNLLKLCYNIKKQRSSDKLIYTANYLNLQVKCINKYCYYFEGSLAHLYNYYVTGARSPNEENTGCFDHTHVKQSLDFLTDNLGVKPEDCTIYAVEIFYDYYAKVPIRELIKHIDSCKPHRRRRYKHRLDYKNKGETLYFYNTHKELDCLTIYNKSKCIKDKTGALPCAELGGISNMLRIELRHRQRLREWLKYTEPITFNTNIRELTKHLSQKLINCIEGLNIKSPYQQVKIDLFVNAVSELG